MPSAERLRDRLREAIEYVSGPADDVTRWAEARDDGSEHKTGDEDSGYDEHGAKRPRSVVLSSRRWRSAGWCQATWVYDGLAPAGWVTWVLSVGVVAVTAVVAFLTFRSFRRWQQPLPVRGRRRPGPNRFCLG